MLLFIQNLREDMTPGILSEFFGQDVLLGPGGFSLSLYLYTRLQCSSAVATLY